MGISAEQMEQATALARRLGATRLILFASAQDDPHLARDLDLACEGVAGWRLYELAASIEDEINEPLDLVPLQPATLLTRHIDSHGRTVV